MAPLPKNWRICFNVASKYKIWPADRIPTCCVKKMGIAPQKLGPVHGAHRLRLLAFRLHGAPAARVSALSAAEAPRLRLRPVLGDSSSRGTASSREHQESTHDRCGAKTGIGTAPHRSRTFRAQFWWWTARAFADCDHVELSSRLGLEIPVAAHAKDRPCGPNWLIPFIILGGTLVRYRKSKCRKVKLSN
jgi:hypothetical protein